MIYDSIGLPKDNGATDYMDSARLAGLLAVFNHPNKLSQSLLDLYSFNGICVRYPGVDPSNKASDNPLNVTRDQIVCLVAGYAAMGMVSHCQMILDQVNFRGGILSRAQNVEADVVGSTKPWYNGADILTPSTMNHLRNCAGIKASNFWLYVDLIFHSIFTPMREPNQILCMAMIAGPSAVRFFKRINPKLNASIEEYWCGWRNEPELAKYMIQMLGKI